MPDNNTVQAPQANPNFPPSQAPVTKIPSKLDKDYAKNKIDAQNRHIENSSLVQNATAGDVVATLSQISRTLARNIELMEYRRAELDRAGSDSTHILGKQSDLLRQLATMQLEVKKLKVDTLDLRSPQFLKVFKFFVDSVVEVAVEVLPPEHVDIFVQNLSTKLEGFEDRAEAIIG